VFEKCSCSTYRKTSAFSLVALIWAITISACATTSTPQDLTGPTITQITTSTKSFSIDCVPTSVTVTANIIDTLGVRHATLWYRVGSDQPYISKNMDVSNHSYSATVKGIELPPGPYGNWEFYIAAENTAGNSNKNPVDNSIQFLPCVSN